MKCLPYIICSSKSGILYSVAETQTENIIEDIQSENLPEDEIIEEEYDDEIEPENSVILDDKCDEIQKPYQITENTNYVIVLLLLYISFIIIGVFYTY